MEALTEFIGRNYGWFLTITIILLFALIGYIYDSKRGKDSIGGSDEIDEDYINHLSVSEDKKIGENINQGTINTEQQNVEPQVVENTNENVVPEVANTDETTNNN